jgi:hypothetical protein
VWQQQGCCGETLQTLQHSRGQDKASFHTCIVFLLQPNAGRGRHGGQAGASSLQGLEQGQAAMLAVLAGKQHFFLEVSRSVCLNKDER